MGLRGGCNWARIPTRTLGFTLPRGGSGRQRSNVEIETGGLETVAIDAETLEALKQLEMFPESMGPIGVRPTVDDVLDTIETRLRAAIRTGNGHRVRASSAATASTVSSRESEEARAL